MESKQISYKKLVDERKKCNSCEGLDKKLTNPRRIHGGRFDSEAIGPWTLWAGDLNAKILIVGQEWGGRRTFEGQKGLNIPSRTNNNLVRLLGSAGIELASLELNAGGHSTGVFLTNAALCMKEGGDSASVSAAWFRNCQKHLRSQIEIVAPCVVVTLGERAYTAVRNAFELRTAWKDVQKGAPTKLLDGTILVPVYHCSPMAHRTRNMELQMEDWRGIGDLLQ